MLFAVDPTLEVAREAAEWGADLLVVHHPLFLKPRARLRARPRPRAARSATLAGRRLRAADRAHQRRPGGRRGLRGAGHGARADRPGADRAVRRPAARQARRLRPGRRTPTRVRAALAEAGRRADRRLRPRVVLDPGRGPVPAARRARDPTIGAVGRVEVVDEVRSRWCCRAAARTPVVAAMLAAHPYEEPAYDVVELADPGRRPTGRRPDRHGRARPRCGASPRPWRPRCRETAHGVRVAGDPRPRRTPGRGVRGSGRLPARRGAAQRRRRLRHQRPAPPPGGGVPRAGRARRWSTSRTGRPSGPGCRWCRRGWSRRWAIRWRPGSARSAPTPGPSVSEQCRPTEEPTLKADPSAQLKLLDLQELDARADQLRHQRANLPELAEIAALQAEPRRARRPGAATPGSSVDDLTAEQTQGRRRRRAGQDPPHPRPDRMDQGLITNPKDLERMQHELESLERRITTLEDDELEVMERLEDAQRDLDALTAQVAAADERLAELRRRARRQEPRRSTPSCSQVAAERGRRRRGHPRRPAGALRQAARAQGRRRRGRAAGPRSAAAASSRSTPPSSAVIAQAPGDEVIRCEECSADPGAHRRVRPVTGPVRPARRSSSRPTAARAATPARRRTAPCSRTPTPAR